jgi:hypothetical protein
VITSFQEQIEWHLRILSLLVGLAVGVLSLIGLWRKLRGRLAGLGGSVFARHRESGSLGAAGLKDFRHVTPVCEARDQGR